MRRDPAGLEERMYDLLVIGGGAVGAWVAREAARSGLASALVEREDFGGGSSSATLRILHAGFRYLRDLDVRRFRRSRRSVTAWSALAPGLVCPLPVAVPATGRGLSRSIPMGAATLLERMLDALSGSGRPAGIPEPARVVSTSELVRLAPHLESLAPAAGLVFHDGLMYSPERLVFAVLRDAVALGASLANHCEARSLSVSGSGYTVRCRDRLDGRDLEVRTKTVVDASGAGAGSTFAELTGGARLPVVGRVRGVNLVLEDVGLASAIAVPSGAGSTAPPGRAGLRYLFATPWRGRTLLGTAYGPDSEETNAGSSDTELTERLLGELKGALPGVELGTGSAVGHHGGWLPLVRAKGQRRIAESPIVVDHGRSGWPGLVTAVADKFTTAPHLARQVLDTIPGGGGSGDPTPSRRDVEDASSPAGTGHRTAFETLPEDVREHLRRIHGADAHRLAGYRDRDPRWDGRLVPGEPSIRAQVHHAVEEEMAKTPEDVAYRRLELGSRGLPVDGCLELARSLLGDLGAEGSPVLPRRDGP